LNTEKAENHDSDFESIAQILRAFRNDPVINEKVIGILKMDSYSRRFVLNNWLEQLRRNNASGKLTQMLSLLFDDSVAKKIFEFIKKSKKNGRNS
jgi:hypothetical protein